MQRRALKQNIIYLVEHYKAEREKVRPYKYFGRSYGEIPSPYRPSRENTYVDLIGKSDEKLVNLAIVKLKMEDDFVSFKLNKFIIIKHRAGTLLLINQQEKEAVAKEDEFLLRNWSYYGLKEKIAYKAKK